MKIDVEGYEQRVLEGLRGTISLHHPDVVVELTDDFLRSVGDSASGLIEMMKACDYQAYRVHDDGLTPLSESESFVGHQFNAFFTVSSPKPVLLGGGTP